MKFFQRIFKAIGQNPILSLILLIGFLLRIIGTSPGYYMHGYEVMYGDAVSMILDKKIGLSYTNLAYPPLVAWIMAVWFLLFTIPLAWLGYVVSHFPQTIQLIVDGLDGTVNFVSQVDLIFNKEILGTRYWQNAMYWGRYITALFGTASITIVYKIVMEYFGKRVMAYLSAFMLAVNYRLVINSHMGFHDIFNVFFLLLTLFAVGKLLKKPTTNSYLFSAISATLAFLIKYQPSAFVAFGIAHLIITFKKSRNLPSFFKNFITWSLINSLILALAILLLSHIDYFIRIKEVLSYSPWVWYANEFGKYQLYLFPFSYVYHTGLGVLLSLASIAGIVVAVFTNKYRQSTLVLLSPILVSFYLFAYFSTGGYYTYNLLIPISVMLIFASLFFEQLREWLVKNSQKRFSNFWLVVLYILALSLVLKDQIKNSIISTYILAQPSYRLVTEEWLNKNLQGPAVLATHTSNPRTQRDDIRLIDLPSLPEIFGYREFLEEKYDYALIDFFKIQERSFWWMLSPPRMPTQFWEKPDNLLSQTHLAMATRELLWNHTIKSFMLKWQASGYNYAVTQIKEPLKLNDTVLLRKFDFKEREDWTPLFFLEKDKDKLFWLEEGKDDSGSITIKKSKEAGNTRQWVTIPGGIRWQSPTFPAKPGFGYKVVGWIKNTEYVEKKFRNGFLRVDFYKGDDKPSVTSRPIISFVSTRLYGESRWNKVEVEGVAPAEANFVKVGFQADDSTVTVILDGVEIYESRHQMKGLDIDHFTIPDEDFFRPSDSSFT